MRPEDESEIVAGIPHLRRYARGLVGDRERADDLVQDTLERACSRLPLWQRRGELRAWMFGIMHNLFVDRLRRQRSSPLDAPDSQPPDAQDLPGRPTQADGLELRDLERALARLPVEQREVLLLVGLQEMSYQDVAHASGVPIGTVMSRLSRARERLRAELDGRGAPAPRPPAPRRSLAAGIALAVLSAGAAWWVRGALDADTVRIARARDDRTADSRAVAANETLDGFARRAAVAHVVYSPDIRRPVEVGAHDEQALLRWLSERLGSAVRPPLLKTVGYELIGGRLLPGESGPVAQFMYHDATGQRMTLYVTREAPPAADGSSAAFRFGRDGPVNVFYWVDKRFGYALSGGAGRQELLRVAQEVHRQLAPG